MVETTVSGGSKRKLDETDSANKSVRKKPSYRIDALRRYDLPPGFQACKKRTKKGSFSRKSKKRYVDVDGKIFTSVQACWDVYEASVKEDSSESSTESGSDEDLPGLYTSAPPLQEHLGDEPDLYQDSSESSADSETEQAEPSVALSVISTKDSSFVSESDKCSPSSFNPSGRTDDVSSGFGSDEVEEKKEKISNHTFSNEYDIPEEVDEDSHTSSDPTPSQPEVNKPAGSSSEETLGSEDSSYSGDESESNSQPDVDNPKFNYSQTPKLYKKHFAEMAAEQSIKQLNKISDEQFEKQLTKMPVEQPYKQLASMAVEQSDKEPTKMIVEKSGKDITKSAADQSGKDISKMAVKQSDEQRTKMAAKHFGPQTPITGKTFGVSSKVSKPSPR